MKVHDLAPAPGSRKSRKRVGRGIGGKGGKTAGRGTKGQRARNTVTRGFEGGQMPLKQRVPKLKGFTNPFRVEYQAVNLDTLQELADVGETGIIDAEVLVRHGLARKGAYIKVLARGEVTTAVQVTPTPSRRPRRRRSGRGRYGDARSAPVQGREQGRSPRRQGQPVHEPVSRGGRPSLRPLPDRLEGATACSPT